MQATSFVGAKVQARAQVQQRRATRVVVSAAAFDSNRLATSFAAAALAAAVLINAPMAKADLTAELLAKSADNKALNDKKRLATSYSNFERSRSVTAGTCKFPNNWFGCDIGAVAGDSPIKQDIALECEGKDAGKCSSNVSIPKRR